MRLDPRICAALLLAFAIVPPAAAGVVIDPTGDTFGRLAIQIDILSYSAFYDAATTRFTINFAQPIAAPSASAPNSVVGYIDIDADRNSSTGLASIINSVAPPPLIALGVEYSIDLFSEFTHRGTVDLIDVITSTVFATVPITYSGNTLTVTIPFTGPMHYGIVAGTNLEATDRAPNGGIPDVSEVDTPEPGYSLLVLLGSTLCVLGRVRRRRQ